MCATVKIQLLSVAPDQKWRNVTYRGPDRAMKGVLGTLCHMIVVRGVLSKSLLFAWVGRDFDRAPIRGAGITLSDFCDSSCTDIVESA